MKPQSLVILFFLVVFTCPASAANTMDSIAAKYEQMKREHRQQTLKRQRAQSRKPVYNEFSEYFHQGEAFFFGDNGVQDYNLAFEFFKKAADEGQEEAQYYLGVMYEYGMGVKQDIQEALIRYHNAGFDKAMRSYDLLKKKLEAYR